MSIATILHQNRRAIVSVAPDSPARDAARLLAGHRIGALLVLDAAGRVVGLLSESDIVRAVAERPQGLAGLRVAALMRRDLVMVGPDTAIPAAIEMLAEGSQRHLPVVDPRGGLIAVLGLQDLLGQRAPDASTLVH